MCIFFCVYRNRQGRFKRSNSVTAAVQADMELEGFPVMEDKGLQFGGGFQRHSEPSTPTQYGAVRTVRTQGLFSYRDDYRTPAEPPSPRETSRETTWQLEPPSPRESAASSAESGRASPSMRRDGSWFMQLLHTDTKRIEGWCKEMEAEAEENDLSEESECERERHTHRLRWRGGGVAFSTPRVCVCVFQFSAKSEVQWEVHNFSCPRSSSSSTGCVSRTW